MQQPSMPAPGRDQQIILGVLSTQGIASSKDLQRATGKSQATLSRLLADLSDHVLTLGKGRARLYGLPKSIRGLPAQQPIYWLDESGKPTRIGLASLLAGEQLHVETDQFSITNRGALPWFLAPLRAQGFLGRLLAQHLQHTGIESDPERWGLESTLFAALHLHAAPGAIALGEPQAVAANEPLPSNPQDLANALDALSADVAKTLPAGSSAGGEQPKFLAKLSTGQQVLVKFTPPLGTPFGQRWHDLLHTEALALEMLSRHGVQTAACSVVSSTQRSYLVSERFDRVGPTGRRHMVPVEAAHAGFVPGGYNNWAATCEALSMQKRLDAAEAATARLLLQFGRLIGNTDMHSGNLSLMVDQAGLSKGRFKLAPAYDMLPMRWRPDPMAGGAADYAPFELDMVSMGGPARPLALQFWIALTQRLEVSPELRQVAAVMAERLG